MIPKFRAWDEKDREMCDVISLDWKHEIIEVSNGYAIWPRDFFEVEIMQSTGLKDNDGIEFYEKDIVRNIDSEELGVVEYDEGQFRVSYNGVSEQLWEIDKDLQIIGNIYENPELLEG